MYPPGHIQYAGFLLKDVAMKTVEEYHAHAQECRLLASKAVNEEEKRKYLLMARGWEELATERERRLRIVGDPKQPDGAPLAARGEQPMADDLDFSAEQFGKMSKGDRVRICRRLAERARKLADLSSPKHREGYLVIARQWDKLASDDEQEPSAFRCLILGLGLLFRDGPHGLVEPLFRFVAGKTTGSLFEAGLFLLRLLTTRRRDGFPRAFS
jgi:hypothetical protein